MLGFQRPGARHVLVLALPALFLGYLIVAQASTQSARSELAVRYNTPLIEAVNALQKEQNDLKVQLADLRAKLGARKRLRYTRAR